MTQLISELGRTGEFGTQAEFAVRLAGLANAGAVSDSRRPPQRRWAAIDADMLRQLLDHLPPGKPDSPLSAVRNNDFGHPGVVRLLANVIWLTGLRFKEVFGYRLMRPRSGTAAQALQDPLKAERMGLLETCLRAPDDDVDGIESRWNGRPPVMIVKTAKAKLASPGIDNRQRALILSGIEPREFYQLAAAQRIQLAGLEPSQLDSIRRKCSVALNRASRDAFPRRADPISLHTLRHAFADAAREGMDPASAAALTGHTAPSTLRGYGRKRPTGFSGRQPTRWLPQPDPARAELLKAVWEARKRPFPYHELSPKPELPEPAQV